MDANKKLEKKKKIIETAYQQFRNAGVSATAIDDVVKAAGIARGTFYLYFKDKSDLIDQLVLYKSGETMKEMLKYAREKLVNDGSDFYTIVRKTLEMYIDFMEEHKDILAVLNKNISACMRSFPNFGDNEANSLYSGIIDEFVQMGFSENQANKTVFIVISMIDSVCSDAILYSRPFPLSQIRETLIDAAMTIFAGENALQSGRDINEDIA